MRLPVHVGFVLPVIQRADSAADSGIGHRPRIGPQLTSTRVNVYNQTPLHDTNYIYLVGLQISLTLTINHARVCVCECVCVCVCV